MQLWSSENDSTFAKCEGEDLEVVGNGVEQWTTIGAAPAGDVPGLPEDLGSDEGADTGAGSEATVQTVTSRRRPHERLVVSGAPWGGRDPFLRPLLIPSKAGSEPPTAP